MSCINKNLDTFFTPSKKDSFYLVVKATKQNISATSFFLLKINTHWTERHQRSQHHYQHHCMCSQFYLIIFMVVTSLKIDDESDVEFFYLCFLKYLYVNKYGWTRIWLWHVVCLEMWMVFEDWVSLFCKLCCIHRGC